MQLETILGVWGGLYLDSEVIAEEDLQPYIDDVLNELEFLMVCQTLHLAWDKRSFSCAEPNTVLFD